MTKKPAVDENDCQRDCGVFECKPVCPPVCMMFCEHGNVVDENDCPVCQCNKGPPPVVCTREAKKCLDGGTVNRNPEDDCKFFPCPKTTTAEPTTESTKPAPVMCTLTDGTMVKDGFSGTDTGDNFCNTCSCRAGQLSCTEMACVQEEHDCFTKEVWSDEKSEWCCENKQLGCPADVVHGGQCRPGSTDCSKCTNGQLLRNGVCITEDACAVLGGVKRGRVCADSNNDEDRPPSNNRCSDSTSWKYKGKSKKDCNWVGKKPEKRCKLKHLGDRGKKARNECKAACGTCPGRQ